MREGAARALVPCLLLGAPGESEGAQALSVTPAPCARQAAQRLWFGHARPKYFPGARLPAPDTDSLLLAPAMDSGELEPEGSTSSGPRRLHLGSGCQHFMQSCPGLQESWPTLGPQGSSCPQPRPPFHISAERLPDLSTQLQKPCPLWQGPRRGSGNFSRTRELLSTESTLLA